MRTVHAWTAAVVEKCGETALTEVFSGADYVADLKVAQDGTTLVACTDGQLGVVRPSASIGAGESRVLRSEQQGDELLSVALAPVVEGGGNAAEDARVVVGGQEGPLMAFNWGRWADPVEKLRGHPQSVVALDSVAANVVVTGSNDGLLRLIGVAPAMELLGVLGDQGDEMPVEALSVGPELNAHGAIVRPGEAPAHRFVASIGHEDAVYLWDLAPLYALSDADEAEAERTPSPEPQKRAKKKRKRGSKNTEMREATGKRRLGEVQSTAEDSFFAGL